MRDLEPTSPGVGEVDEARDDAGVGRVWFIGPWDQPGFFLRVSEQVGKSKRSDGERVDSWYRPPSFPWKSMDRKWGACHKPQGTTAMDYADGWSVLSVADYTIDSRPNVLVAFAVQRPDVPEAEMRRLAEAHYPSVWKRLGVTECPPHDFDLLRQCRKCGLGSVRSGGSDE